MNRHFYKGDIHGQWTHEKMLNITTNKGDANQSHNELTPHTCQNS